MYFFLINPGTLKTATQSPPIQFRSFYPLKHSLPYSDADSTPTNQGMKLLLPQSSSYQIAYGLSSSDVLCLPLKDTEEPDKINFGEGGKCGILPYQPFGFLFRF